MKIIHRKDKYRVVVKHSNIYNEYDEILAILSYKVQMKVLFFWITIKTFEEGVYDEDSDFCKREAIELYNKIIDCYGTV